MKISLQQSHRILLAYAFLLIIVAIVLIVGVIPSVKDEVLRGGTPEKAVIAFWVNVGLNALSAVILISIAIRSKSRTWISTTLIVLTGFIVFLLGLALSDAAAAYSGHGPAMETASTLLFVCAALDILMGIAMIITAYLRPEEHSSVKQQVVLPS